MFCKMTAELSTKKVVSAVGICWFMFPEKKKRNALGSCTSVDRLLQWEGFRTMRHQDLVKEFLRFSHKEHSF